MSSQSVPGPFDINSLLEEAQTRWLKLAEVLFILQNHDKYQLTHEPPQRPTSGSLYLFNKRVLRFFRRDGHNWRKKRDGRTVGEAHERLKVGNTETLNCYYAHGEDNPNFQRRSYWMLDPAFDHIVLVHYREITEVVRTLEGDMSLLDLNEGIRPGNSRLYGSCLGVDSSGSGSVVCPGLLFLLLVFSRSVASDCYCCFK